jgi:hypothetical protein
MHIIGQAYDIKQVTPDMINQRRKKTGDLSNSNYKIEKKVLEHNF